MFKKPLQTTCIDNQNLCDYLLFYSEDEPKVLESFKLQ